MSAWRRSPVTWLLRALAMLALAATSSGCLMVILQYPDGAVPAGNAEVDWKLQPTDSWKRMEGAGSIYWACAPCFKSVGIPCDGRGPDGLPASNRVPQPGTASGVNTTVSWRLRTLNFPFSFPNVRARTTFRYLPVAKTENQLNCTGDDTQLVLLMPVVITPASGGDDMIYRRCSSIGHTTGGGNLFEDKSFCAGGSLGWGGCTNNESHNGAAGQVRPCTKTYCSTNTCGGRSFDFQSSSCCSCYKPNYSATNAYGQPIFVLDSDGSSPYVQRWNQRINGTWEVTLGFDFQAVGIPLGGAEPTCCPACGGAAAGTLGACYCRLCQQDGGGAKTSGCVPTNPISSTPWAHYVSFINSDQFKFPASTLLRLDNAAAKVVIKDGGSNFSSSVPAPYNYFTKTTHFYNLSWYDTWRPGTRMKLCGPTDDPCLVGQERPDQGNCTAYCDPGKQAVCRDNNSQFCYTSADCPGATPCGGPGTPAGQQGQISGLQVSFGHHSDTYGQVRQDFDHLFGQTHGPNSDGVQVMTRQRFDVADFLIFDGHYPPFNYPYPSAESRTFTFDLTGAVEAGKTLHTFNAFGCGGPAAGFGGTNYTGPCNPATQPTLCASSCVAPASVGHAGKQFCENGGCYQYMFAELTNLADKPVLFGFGAEGAWASKGLIKISDWRLGRRTGMR